MIWRLSSFLGLLLAVWQLLGTAQPVDIETGQTPRLRTPASWDLPAPPSAEQQDQAERTIRQLLAGRVDLESPDTPALCRELRNLARGTTDDPAARYVLSRMAYELAQKSEQFLFANEVIDDLARWYSIDSLAMRVEVLAAATESPTDDPAVLSDRFNHAIHLLESALMADRFDLAAHIITRAQLAAARIDQPEYHERFAQWSAVHEQWSQQARVASHAALRLFQQPQDADAQLALGRYLCFTKGDWARGLPHLARGRDGFLRGLAEVDLNSRSDAPTRIDLADKWRAYAGTRDGLARRRIILHAEEIDRRLYPTITGLTRLKLGEHMLSRPLFVFETSDPPTSDWIEEHLHFRGGHGREGSGSWAKLEVENGAATLVANRAGFIETIERFPPPGVAHYEIEVELQSDIGNGAALEFAGQRMYLDRSDGIRMERGWLPNVIYPIRGDRSDRYLIDVTPEGITFTLNGVELGTMRTDRLTPAGIVIRGWEGHIRCRRLVVWTLPGGDIATPLPEVALPSASTPGETLLDADFQADLATLRRTAALPEHRASGVPSRASSGQAIAAASRVFARFPTVGTTRTRVLQVLGDPMTISGYGVAAKDDADGPLVYRFDTGRGGVQFTIHFKDGLVTRVESQTLE